MHGLQLQTHCNFEESIIDYLRGALLQKSKQLNFNIANFKTCQYRNGKPFADEKYCLSRSTAAVSTS